MPERTDSNLVSTLDEALAVLGEQHDCQLCKGAGKVRSSEWVKYDEAKAGGFCGGLKLTCPERFDAQGNPKIPESPEMVACAHCRGLGFVFQFPSPNKSRLIMMKLVRELKKTRSELANLRTAFQTYIQKNPGVP